MPRPAPGASPASPLLNHTRLRIAVCLVAAIGALTACQSAYRPPGYRSPATLIDVYRSTLLECAGEPNESRQHDGTEWMRFKECAVQLNAGYVVAQHGNCTPYLRCR